MAPSSKSNSKAKNDENKRPRIVPKSVSPVKETPMQRAKKQEKIVKTNINDLKSCSEDFLLKAIYLVFCFTRISEKRERIQKIEWFYVFKSIMAYIKRIDKIVDIYKRDTLTTFKSDRMSTSERDELDKEMEKKEKAFHWHTDIFVECAAYAKSLFCDQINREFLESIDQLTDNHQLTPEENVVMNNWSRFFREQKWETFQLTDEQKELAQKKLNNLQEYAEFYEFPSPYRDPVLNLQKVQVAAGEWNEKTRCKPSNLISYWERELTMMPFLIFLDQVDWSIVSNLIITFSVMKEHWRPKIVVGDRSPFDDNNPIVGHYEFHSGLLGHAIALARAGEMSRRQKKDNWLQLKLIPKECQPKTVPRHVTLEEFKPEVEMTEDEITQEQNEQRMVKQKLKTLFDYAFLLYSVFSFD